MIKITDENRREIQKEYVGRMIEGMDLQSLEIYATDMLMKSVEDETDESLITLIKDYAPDILEES
jgi:hypothetical protein